MVLLEVGKPKQCGTQQNAAGIPENGGEVAYDDHGVLLDGLRVGSRVGGGCFWPDWVLPPMCGKLNRSASQTNPETFVWC